MKILKEYSLKNKEYQRGSIKAGAAPAIEIF